MSQGGKYMKHFMKKSLLLVSVLFLLCMMVPVTAEAKVKLNKKEVILNLGESTRLKVTGTKKKVTWSSSNKYVATVTKTGKVRAKKEGTAIIKAKVGKKTYKCRVIVADYYRNNYKAVAKAFKTGNSSQLGVADKKVLKEVKKVISQNIRDDMTDAEKARVLHDWVCNNTTYESFTKGYVIGYVNYFDVLLKRKACCAGFTGVYQLFMECLGIENQVAHGTNHAWNVVKIDGEWYNVELTYDYNHGNGVIYSYFLKSDQWMPKGPYHDAGKEKKKCTSEKYETYPYTGKYPVINTTEEYKAYLETIKSQMKDGERRTITYLYYTKNIEFFMLEEMGLSDLSGETLDHVGRYNLDRITIVRKLEGENE